MDKVEAMVLDQIEQSGETIFWAVLKEKADLSRAPTIQNSDERGEFVYDELTKVADESQSGLNSLLSKEGVSHESFWIANAVRITADRSVLAQVAALPGVDKVLADRTHDLPEPQPVDALPTVDAVEWGIDRIRADDVWSTFGVRGEGLVVANVDSGVQFDHPALVGSTAATWAAVRSTTTTTGSTHRISAPRRRLATTTTTAPTMGTMVGDDGAGNQIGVAPGARWIAAKGCETNNCSLSAARLRPVDRGADRPKQPKPAAGPGPRHRQQLLGRPGQRPVLPGDRVGLAGSEIFPQFSNGSNGPSCNTSGSPGDYVNSYSAGAFDINNNIASFSSRGAAAVLARIKPNIAAPGVNVRSSVPGNVYASFNGTSMASPHVAGTVTLMWSAAPAIARHRRHPSAARRHRDRHAERHLWRHRRTTTTSLVRVASTHSPRSSSRREARPVR